MLHVDQTIAVLSCGGTKHSIYPINMSQSRRNFLKRAALLAGGAGAWATLPSAIHKAFAIAPDPGTTFYDAEHVVMLMQENRSFDHCFGTLRGVRGFNDPFPVTLPDKKPVWFQPDKTGNCYLPFRLNMKDTRATWMGGVPHSWEDQVDARNDGKYDGWIEAKRPGNKDFKHIPLTMGYYTREDIPFYHALADAFTVCDQHFCSALTGTTTNRSYFWTGKTHGDPGDKAKVRNGEVTYEREASWKTFPERLEDEGISWTVYQNEVSLPTNVEDASLLANFTDNNLEWFTQFNVRFSKGFYEWLQKQKSVLPNEIRDLETKVGAGGSDTEEHKKQLQTKRQALAKVMEHLEKWTPEAFSKLTPREQNLHIKAFTTNTGDPDYQKVEEMTYESDGEKRSTNVPKGDILYQFRKDVNEGKLPTVSWLVPPQKFSDHPSAPWYGAWYVSEVLDILTQHPEVWKKTIFILNYDENDGYFDHVPPFVAPNPNDPATGKVSGSIDVSGEFVTLKEEVKAGFKPERSRTSPVGLGYRVPLIIASPWSRGGWVNSELCDITSTIRFMEKFLSKKAGRKIEETNISSWRRTVCGDLTSAFRPYRSENIALPDFLNRNEHIAEIYNASFRGLPDNYRALSPEEADELVRDPRAALPQQEQGTKPSNALKYELYVDGALSDDGKEFVVKFKASNAIFGDDALGSAFNVYAPGNYLNEHTGEFEPVKVWAFAVKAGAELEYRWPLSSFGNKQYHLTGYGPNGFYREFRGTLNTHVFIDTAMPRAKGTHSSKLEVRINNRGKRPVNLVLSEEKYQTKKEAFTLKPGTGRSVLIDVTAHQGWYDFSILSEQESMLIARYAGRVETGADSISDPYMGRVLSAGGR